MNNFLFRAKMKSSKILYIGATALTERIRDILHGNCHSRRFLSAGCFSTQGRGDCGDQASTMNIADAVRCNGFSTIVVDERGVDMPLCGEHLLHLKYSGIPVFEASHFYEQLTGKTPVRSVDASWLLYHHQKAGARFFISKLLKTISDKIIALCGILVSAPFMALCALAIKLTSPGKAIFRQERLGLHEKPFVLMKFRTMIDHAERETGPKWAEESDPRITTVGRFLRKTRLDELPQLFNVLKGEMSIVGPRPIRKHFADILAQDIPYYRLRFTVKPGVTGWAQVCGDYAGSHEGQMEKFEYDLYYLRHQSLHLDLLILFKTVTTVFRHRGQ